MGLILDSSVLVAAERQGKNAHHMLASVFAKVGETEIALSVITLIEMAHGVARADTRERKTKREQFIQELLTALPIHPITASLALRAGQIDGENQARGTRVPLADLLIGVTALELGYGVGTSNIRHFQMVSGLSVVDLWLFSRKQPDTEAAVVFLAARMEIGDWVACPPISAREEWIEWIEFRRDVATGKFMAYHSKNLDLDHEGELRSIIEEKRVGQFRITCPSEGVRR